VSDLDAITSVLVKICAECGGFLEAHVTRAPPVGCHVHRGVISLWIGTDRDLEPYYGGCDCEASP
jgi:hypothetical protein